MMWRIREVPIDTTKKIDFAPLSSKDMDKIMQNLVFTDQVERYKPKAEGSLIPWVLAAGVFSLSLYLIFQSF